MNRVKKQSNQNENLSSQFPTKRLKNRQKKTDITEKIIKKQYHIKQSTTESNKKCKQSYSNVLQRSVHTLQLNNNNHLQGKQVTWKVYLPLSCQASVQCCRPAVPSRGQDTQFDGVRDEARWLSTANFLRPHRPTECQDQTRQTHQQYSLQMLLASTNITNHHKILSIIISC